ncbi:dihydroorotase [Aureitalea marina]|uniref:Dihydroorotase n=1 Tax=Aureitalea marina TaxID=930804 RepID=A0A2S7KPI3_9FLAO|nr:dihydroorotase [Aureitalea marina]PQB04488.1 dihydroorotase [Aureitalea marina]
MKLLIKSAILVDANSKHHLKKRDLLIENGKISRIAAQIKDDQIKQLKLDNLHISPGWFDPSVSFGEPGYEERETIANGLNVAAWSGFTTVGINTNTNPIPDTKSGIEYIKTKGSNHAVEVCPVGALTVQSEGVDLAELYDMQQEGALCFYDHKKPISNPNLLKIALQYAHDFDGLVQSFPLEAGLARKGVANEHVNATRLGLKGIPALSEEVQLSRDLQILEYTGGKLHIPTISTAGSVDLIKNAQAKGLQVSCSVSVNNLVMTDEVLEQFDTRYKLMPPLRTEKDRKALIKGLSTGVISGVTSDHNPIDVEHKQTEFDHAYFGSIGLESCFGALNRVLGTEETVKSLTGLKQAFGIPTVTLDEGQKADLTLFNPDSDWIFGRPDIRSGSYNAAMIGWPMKGRVYGVYCGKKLLLSQ